MYKISEHPSSKTKNFDAKENNDIPNSSIGKYDTQENQSNPIVKQEKCYNAFTKISGNIIKKITNDKNYPNILLNWSDNSQVECNIIGVHYYTYNGTPGIYALATPLFENNPYVPYAFMICGHDENSYGLLMCDDTERNMVVLDYNENLHKQSESFDYISESDFQMLVNSTQDNVEYSIKWNDGKIRSSKKEKKLFIDKKYGDILFMIVSTIEPLANNQDVIYGLFMICAGNSNYHILECNDKFLIEKVLNEYANEETRNVQRNRDIDFILSIIIFVLMCAPILVLIYIFRFLFF